MNKGLHESDTMSKSILVRDYKRKILYGSENI
jgi:hypothetical protein